MSRRTSGDAPYRHCLLDYLVRGAYGRLGERAELGAGHGGRGGVLGHALAGGCFPLRVQAERKDAERRLSEVPPFFLQAVYLQNRYKHQKKRA